MLSVKSKAIVYQPSPINEVRSIDPVAIEFVVPTVRLIRLLEYLKEFRGHSG